MSISAPRLRLSRHGTYCFRYLVPPQFIEQVGKKELRRSLRTKNSQIAKIVALHLNALIEKALKDLTPQLAMDEIKKLLAAGVHGFTIKTKNLEITTNGTKEDAESLVYSFQNKELRELVERDIAEGGKLSVTIAEQDNQPISALFQLPVTNPMRITQAIDKYLERKPRAQSTKRAAGKPISADKKTTIVAFESYVASGYLENISLASYVHQLQVLDIQHFLTDYATRKPQKIKRNNSKKFGDDGEPKDSSAYEC